MKQTKLFTALTALICVVLTSNAQSYVGLTADNYAGVHGLIFNPSNVVDSRFKADINIASLSGFAGSDYFGISIKDAIDSEDGFDFDDDVERTPTNANNFFGNVDVLGPSFMFNLSPKSSIAVSTRARAMFNIHNINGDLYESLTDDFDENEDFNFDSKDLTGTIHAWAEIGLTYGRILVDKEKHFLKGGVTIKYLQGAGSVFVNSPNFTGNYDATNEILTSTGSLAYGNTQDFDNDDINFDNLTAGFGADIGFTYEYRPHKKRDDLNSKAHNKYKLKLGVAITDIGSIDYDESTLTTYDVNANVDASTFDEDTDVDQFLDDNYTFTEEIITQNIKLPTALRLLADYQIKGKFYLSAQANLSLTDVNAIGTNGIVNTFVISPRLETKWFSIYSPLSLREYGSTTWGAGLRLGPLVVGSGSALSNLFSDSVQTTDVYVGLKVPIYQKKN